MPGVGATSLNIPPSRPLETPRDLKKRVRGLEKNLGNVLERLVQTERQIFDLERSYLEETRLYGNVLEGWEAYLDSKGKGGGGGGGAAIGAVGGTIINSSDIMRGSGKRDAAEAAGDGGGGGSVVGGDVAATAEAIANSKRAKGVELEERLFSLGSVTSPAAKGLQKLEDARRRASVKQVDVGGGGPGPSASGGVSAVAPKTPKTKSSGKSGKGGASTATKSSKKDGSKKKKR